MATLQEIKAVMTGFPRTLSWNNFRTVQASPSPPSMAQSGSSYFRQGGWRPHLVNGEYRVRGLRIDVTVNRNASWTVRSAQTNDLLRHEQGHYDITGLIARDLAINILDLSLDASVVASLTDSGNTPAQHLRYVQQLYQTDINNFSQRATDLMNRLQTNPITMADGIYDTQTNHGLNTAVQLVWDSRFQRIKSTNESFELCLALDGVI